MVFIPSLSYYPSFTKWELFFLYAVQNFKWQKNYEYLPVETARDTVWAWDSFVKISTISSTIIVLFILAKFYIVVVSYFV